jgi:hypothetical protein
MLFKQASAGDERVFVAVKNVDASSITTGNTAMYVVGNAASFDGIQAFNGISTSAAPWAWIGISVKDIAVNAFGLIQTYGNCSSILYSNIGTSVTVGVGAPLVPSALSGAVASAAPTFANSGFNFIIASNGPTNTLSQTGLLYGSGFLRCLK